MEQWDESVRGPKMSSTQGLTIYKYQMPILEEFTMDLPMGANILRVEDQDGMFWMWAMIDTRAEMETRHFVAVKTGGSFPEVECIIKYLGFCRIFIQMELGLYIFEVAK